MQFIGRKPIKLHNGGGYSLDKSKYFPDRIFSNNLLHAIENDFGIDAGIL